MPTYDIIGGIVSKEAQEQLDKLKLTTAEIAKNFENMKNLSAAIGGKNYEKFSADAARLEKTIAAVNVQKAKEGAIEDERERKRVLFAQKQEARDAKEAKAAQAKIGYINQLEQEVKELMQAYAMLNKEELGGDKGQQALMNLKNKREELAGLKAAYGDMRMNVGNYSSATKMLGINIGQVLKEMPNFAISMRTGIMSLTNNLPMLAETIKQVRVEQLAMIAAGKQAPSMFSLIAKSVFGLTGIMSVLMVLMQLFGARIIEWIGNLIKGEKALKSITAAALGLKSSLGVMREALAGSEMTRAIESINKLSTNLKNAKGNAKESEYYVGEFNKTLGDTFGKAKNVDEALGLIDKNKDAYIQAMKQMTFANTLFAKSAEYMTKIVEVGMKPQMQILREAGLNATKMYEQLQTAKKSLAINEKSGTQVYIPWMENYDEKYVGGSKAKELIAKREKEISEIIQKERNRQIGIYTKGMDSMSKEAEKAAKLMSDIWDKNGWGFPTKEETEKVEEKNKKAKESYYDFDILLYKKMQDNLKAYISFAEKAFDKQKKEFDEMNAALRKGTNISGVASEWADIEGKEFDDWWKNYQKHKDLKQQAKEESFEIEKDIVANLIDIWGVFYEWQAKKIDENLNIQSKINDEKIKQYEDETEAGMHSQQELSDYKDRINYYQQSQEEEAAKKKEEIQRNQFLLSQAITASEIVFNYLKAIGKNTATFGTVLAAPLNALELANMITGLALTAAQTIPYFEQGGIMQKDGMAIVGEKRHEFGINPDGSFFITPDKPTLMQLQKGTQILPDANKIDLNSIIALRQVGFNHDNNLMVSEMRKITNAIKTQKQGNFYGMPLIKQLQRSESIASRRKSLMN